VERRHIFRGCCGTWSPNDSLHFTLLYNNESDTSVGSNSLHPQSTTLDEPSNRLFCVDKKSVVVEHTLFEVGLPRRPHRPAISIRRATRLICCREWRAQGILSAVRTSRAAATSFCRRDPPGFSLARIAHDFRGTQIFVVVLNHSSQRGEIQAFNAAQQLVFGDDVHGNRFSMSRTAGGCNPCQ